ncbi:MAG: glycosyltransferase [Labilithrix sp.]|nr:glycosyltransferase [Labilithrix sp.]
MLFSLTRYLRDQGVDAELRLLNDEDAHFHPSADTFDLSYQQFVRRVGWGDPREIARISADDVARSVRGFDFLIGCGSVPAYLDKIGRALDIFIPYGSDLIELPFEIQGPRRRAPFSIVEAPLRQRRGVRRSKTLWGDRSIAFDRATSRLRYSGARAFKSVPMVYTPLYSPNVLHAYYDRSHWYGHVKELRDRVDVLVLHHARHIWGADSGIWQAKGNDKLVHGFAQACTLRKDVKFGLVFLEYGPDVERTRELVHQLGLESQVLWLPQTLRKEVMIAMSLADIGCGEFANSWLSCGTVYETLAMGKPLLHRRDDELYSAFFPELYPLMNVRTAADVARHLVDYVDRPDHWNAVGEAGRTWHQRYAVDHSIDAILAKLGVKPTAQALRA